MSIAVKCPTCGKRLRVPDEAARRSINCPDCQAPVPVPANAVPHAAPPDFDFSHADETPPPPSRPTRRPPPPVDDEDEDDRPAAREKFCHECGRRIRYRAEICPGCGVRQPDRGRRRRDRSSPGESARDGLKVTLLVSAVSNIVVGLIWLSTCFGVVFTVPMVALCVFEFLLWSKADRLSDRRFAAEAKTLAICEIVIGLLNTPTLICGIIGLINAGKLADPDPDDYDDD